MLLQTGIQIGKSLWKTARAQCDLSSSHRWTRCRRLLFALLCPSKFAWVVHSAVSASRLPASAASQVWKTERANSTSAEFPPISAGSEIASANPFVGSTRSHSCLPVWFRFAVSTSGPSLLSLLLYLCSRQWFGSSRLGGSGFRSDRTDSNLQNCFVHRTRRRRCFQVRGRLSCACASSDRAERTRSRSWMDRFHYRSLLESQKLYSWSRRRWSTLRPLPRVDRTYPNNTCTESICTSSADCLSNQSNCLDWWSLWRSNQIVTPLGLLFC